MANSTHKERVLKYLQDEPLFRERKNRERGIVNMLIARYPELKEIKKETIIEAIHDAATIDRWWRKHLEEHPELRGSDYDSKEELEREKQKELGYNIKD